MLTAGDPRYVPLEDSDLQPGRRNPRIMEWQWAQTAMAMHYLSYFSQFRPGYVLCEADYARLLLSHDDIDDLFDRMVEVFRNYRRNGRGGLLRPDILGIYLRGGSNLPGVVGIELLEVTTAKEAEKTRKEDLIVKAESLRRIASDLEGSIRQGFKTSSVKYVVGPGTWKPRRMSERIVPLPIREDPQGVRIEWICFNPTFRLNEGVGVDGLLLYEIHTVVMRTRERTKAINRIQLEAVRKKFSEAERNRRTVEGLLPPPWYTPDTAKSLFTKDEQLLILGAAALCGIGLFAYFAVPVLIAELSAATLSGTAAASVSAVGSAGAGGLTAATGPATVQLMTEAAMLRTSVLLAGTMNAANEWEITTESIAKAAGFK